MGQRAAPEVVCEVAAVNGAERPYLVLDVGRRQPRRAGEPRAVKEIVNRCSRLPLALAIAAARASAYPHLPLAALAADLRDTHDRLDALVTDDAGTGVRAVFSWSYRTLRPDTARLFRLLGPHPGPDVTAREAADLAGLPAAQVRPLLAELTRAHLITEHAPDRYTFHDLLGSYATEQAEAYDLPAACLRRRPPRAA